jgi:hypothetical protein
MHRPTLTSSLVFFQASVCRLSPISLFPLHRFAFTIFSPVAKPLRSGFEFASKR